MALFALFFLRRIFGRAILCLLSRLASPSSLESCCKRKLIMRTLSHPEMESLIDAIINSANNSSGHDGPDIRVHDDVVLYEVKKVLPEIPDGQAVSLVEGILQDINRRHGVMVPYISQGRTLFVTIHRPYPAGFSGSDIDDVVIEAIKEVSASDTTTSVLVRVTEDHVNKILERRLPDVNIGTRRSLCKMAMNYMQQRYGRINNPPKHNGMPFLVCVDRML